MCVYICSFSLFFFLFFKNLQALDQLMIVDTIALDQLMMDTVSSTDEVLVNFQMRGFSKETQEAASHFSRGLVCLIKEKFLVLFL